MSRTWKALRETVHAKWCERWCATHPPDLGKDTWEYLFTGGKEIRAQLFCELWDYLDTTGRPIPAEWAFMIECIHVASLILDDSPWMDNATTRRGKPTLHVRYSEKKALAVAYDVMRMAYQIWMDHRPDRWPIADWIRFLEQTLERIVRGQGYDLEQKGTLYELASLKTGVLFEFTCECVAIGVGLDRTYWRHWGNQMGILFQWADDWHDREEDRIQQNRNAFNESYEETAQQYQMIWQSLTSQIGPSWFRRPFGDFMQTYFTIDVPLSSVPSLSLLAQASPLTAQVSPLTARASPLTARASPSPLATSLFQLDKLMAYLSMICHRLDVFDESLKMNLWELPEEEWTDELMRFHHDVSLSFPS